MAYTVLADHERDDGSVISVGENSRGPSDLYMLVFDALDGLETVIHFTDVEHTGATYEFTVARDNRPHGSYTMNSGSIEADDFGAVTDWLDEFMAGSGQRQ